MIPGIIAGRRTAAPVNDPLWASVRSLVHFDGADGATSITDQKGVAWTRDGAAVLATAQKKFGTASLRLVNTTGDDGFRAAADLISPSGQLKQLITIEGWMRVDTLAGYQYNRNPLIGQGASSGSTDQSFGIDDGKVTFYRAAGLSGGNRVVQGTTVIAVDTWHHVAMTYDGSVIRVFLDGVLEASATDNTAGWQNTGSQVRIGRTVVAGYEQYRQATRGYIDELRITRACRYTSSFAPPSAPFPNS
ncbi:hypothetical protein B9Y88_03045 [Stenotrophomonas maltophilia]|nr:hypothetical protein B9Y88_03045 [Stenotrophomonas maltophilia]